jgi:hypothetical protein
VIVNEYELQRLHTGLVDLDSHAGSGSQSKQARSSKLGSKWTKRMQEQTGAPGAGDAVDMEEEHAHQQPCAGAGRVQGSVQEVSKASDRFEVRAVTSRSEVLDLQGFC